ncbi:ComC/BlpC family peptide pheromone/bacteriocin [Streptococcus infantis]|uniref:ComC/BlpC family peptide pheromone/bacteriocin n=1 Tax=Streptococcus infantis TaxID=68892 RepID=UPI0039C28A27
MLVFLRATKTTSQFDVLDTEMLSSIEGETDWGVVGRGAVYGTVIGVSMCTAGVLSGAFQARQSCIL